MKKIFNLQKLLITDKLICDIYDMFENSRYCPDPKIKILKTKLLNLDLKCRNIDYS